MLDRAAVTAQRDPFAGIAAPGEDRIAPIIPSDICRALFKAPVSDGRVQVAVFTDINCPLCRVMDRVIRDLPHDTVNISWHDLPLLGQSSVTGARAIAAADRQEAGEAMRQRLQRSRVVPEEAFIRDVSLGLGLNADRLVADMHSKSVTDQIATSIGLASALRIPGTPSVVIGPFVGIGNRTTAQINALVDRARSAPAGPC